jgi:hypothetical protein
VIQESRTDQSRSEQVLESSSIWYAGKNSEKVYLPIFHELRYPLYWYWIHRPVLPIVKSCCSVHDSKALVVLK